MVRLKTKRTALLLYGVLLVLPTLVLGGLHYHQIWLDYQSELSAVPKNADDASRRLVDGIRERVEQLLQEEDKRPFHQYASLYSPADAMGNELAILPSPLVSDDKTKGVLAWFSFDLMEGYEAEVDLFYGDAAQTPASATDGSANDDLRQAATELKERNLEDGFLRRAARLGAVETTELPLVICALQRVADEHVPCLKQQMPALNQDVLSINTSQFHLRYYREAGGLPRVVATRRVISPGLDTPIEDGVPCLEPLSRGFGLVQGFFVDPYWLFEELPVTISDRVLKGSEEHLERSWPRLQAGPLPLASELPLAAREASAAELADSRSQAKGQLAHQHRTTVSLIESLGIETERGVPTDIGRIDVLINKGEIEARFHSQSLRFLSVAAMLALTLGTGLVLLLRSVGRELAQAEQTENFVAAITHELRTPLSTIRLHGEMLLEGWVGDPERQNEYYRRIVRETGRLSTLVERVLEKARLTAGNARPTAGDLNALLARLRPELEQRFEGQGEDLEFHLEEGLPEVLFTREAVWGILDNLVENARKYASANSEEPIEIRTRRLAGVVVLEVADRGPGVPAEETERVFEAFYRVGTESTRTSKGTGLGLHLVALHAQALGGRASVHAREGGGALFRISFRQAG